MVYEFCNVSSDVNIFVKQRIDESVSTCDNLFNIVISMNDLMSSSGVRRIRLREGEGVLFINV